MNKEVISDKQGIYLMIIFIIGTAVLIVPGLDAKQDLWLANISAMFMALPMVLIYARLYYLFPSKDLFDIIEICFNKFIGKTICILYVWYVFHSTSLVLLNFGLFVHTIAFIRTPKVIPMIGISILCTWVVKEGLEVISRCTELFLEVLMALGFIVVLLLIPDIDVNNLLPILYDGIQPVAEGAFSSFSFPFGEVVVFSMAFSTFKKINSSYKIYTLGLLIGGSILTVTSLITISVIGVNIASNSYFPAYKSISLIDIGDLLQRLEIVMAIAYTLGVFVKISIYLLATSKGIVKLFGFNNHRFIVTLVSLLIINLSYFVHDSIMYNMEWTSEIWTYYAFPFQVIFPIIIWITAEIKRKKYNNQNM
ncbi:GerAB/ArcD/ProY family transporter [Tepidibacter hydrothermalis]|uniref:Endospore germination permease n=1 Tax=Tepidibacter hydrothermalis TaxID=3036126 RepID=A0ABY8ECZ0_9FIRM|nr:endospore germination permease [Tepidibacter hydrothermalis]WFD10805.1 endospore germination permease [Tepidibacter hydrothermalis]